MVVYNGACYYHAKAAAQYLGISRSLFYHNIKNCLEVHYLFGRKRGMYKENDLLALKAN